MRGLWGAVVFCLALSGTVHAEPSKRNRTPAIEKKAPAEAPAMDMEKMQEEMARVQKQLKTQQKEQLERLKQMDPKAYEAQEKALVRQDQINQIISAYNQKSLSAEDAERKLTPLIRQELQDQQGGVDTEIKMLEKKLAALKKAKSDSNAQVKKKVDQMLGRGGPPNPDEMF